MMLFASFKQPYDLLRKLRRTCACKAYAFKMFFGAFFRFLSETLPFLLPQVLELNIFKFSFILGKNGCPLLIFESICRH